MMPHPRHITLRWTTEDTALRRVTSTVAPQFGQTGSGDIGQTIPSRSRWGVGEVSERSAVSIQSFEGAHAPITRNATTATATPAIVGRAAVVNVGTL